MLILGSIFFVSIVSSFLILQRQEFKEAFNMIDQNRDGFIDKDDLHDMLASLGKLPDINVLLME